MKSLLFIFLLLPALIIPSQRRIATPTPGSTSSSTLNTSLIGYWKLDEISDTRFDSGPNGQDLTDVNTVTSNPGIINNAGQFVTLNTTWLSHTDSAFLSVGNISFSVSLWFYMDSAAVNRGIIGKGTAHSTAGLEWDISMLASGLRPSFNMSDGVAITPATWTADLSLSTWYHIVAIYDSTADTMSVIVNNGTPITASQSTGSQDTSGDFVIGRRITSAYIDGRVDEVGFWKKALSASEVTELYNSGAGKTCCPF